MVEGHCMNDKYHAIQIAAEPPDGTGAVLSYIFLLLFICGIKTKLFVSLPPYAHIFLMAFMARNNNAKR